MARGPLTEDRPESEPGSHLRYWTFPVGSRPLADRRLAGRLLPRPALAPARATVGRLPDHRVVPGVSPDPRVHPRLAVHLKGARPGNAGSPASEPVPPPVR